MWRNFRLQLILLLLVLATTSYLEFPLTRVPSDSHNVKLDPIACKNQASLNQDAQYKEICYEKDVSYGIMFINNNSHLFMSVDFTAPISWMKGASCKIDGTKDKCTRIVQTFAEKFKQTKKKITAKLHKSKATDSKQNAIIQGSSEVIHGVIEKGQHMSFISKDSNRLNNFFELMMLGLFIYGEKDVLELDSTNFINATNISSNLNGLSDGAISLRFDETSENSFLNQIFSYVKASQKTVTVYLGANNTLTIGDMTAKYAQSGYSSISWIPMPDDEGFGKMAQMSDIGVEDQTEDTEAETDQTVPAIFTLSASYIGIPEKIIMDVVKAYFAKEANCSINNRTFYLECTASTSKKIEKITQKDLFFGFSGTNIMIPISKLVLDNSNKGKKITLNIKKTYNSRIILGQPIFRQHFILFDYSKNKIGIAPKREKFNQFFINVVSLVRFLCFIFVVGCSFIICYQPCRKMMKAFQGKAFKREGNEGRRLKQYSPLQENPYDELKGQISEAIKSTDKEVEGI